MNDIKIFEHEKFGKLEIYVDENKKEWFPATEIAEILGYKNPRKAILDHCKTKGVTNRDSLTNGGKQSIKYIDEGNLYRLISKSKLKEAEKFETWVFDEVLPMIRKTGMYITDNIWAQIASSPEKIGELLIDYGKAKEEHIN